MFLTNTIFTNHFKILSYLQNLSRKIKKIFKISNNNLRKRKKNNYKLNHH